MAQRLAKIMLYRNREQLSLSGNFGIRAFKLQVGDIVTYSNTHLGFSNKTFEVTGWKFVPTGDGAVEVTLGLSEVSSAFMMLMQTRLCLRATTPSSLMPLQFPRWV
jgi:hypothetical protein